ncbi:MAG: hypothetical protein OEL20_16800 [Sulfuritalea sp.]|nr:hypothetical protein [Sulfuritalea sp.]
MRDLFGKMGPDLAPIREGWDGGSSSISDQRSDEEIVKEHLSDLAKWALDNNRDARNDAIRYWLFKFPAIVCAASTAALESFGYGSAVSIFGVIATICIAIDAAFPGGLLHNTHRQAANEISLLRDKVKIEWDSTVIQYRDVKVPERIAAVQAIL